MEEVNEIRVLNGSGDTRITWNKKKPEEIESARKTFDILVKKNKYMAFSVGWWWKEGDKITEFDPDLQKIILVPVLAGG